MSLYLVDRHASPITSAAILDVQESTQPVLGGRFVVKVPDGIPVISPTNLGDLITKKAQGYLVFYPTYTRVTFDDLLDTSDVDLVNSVGYGVGQRAAMVLEPGGVLQSAPTPLTGSAPGQVIVTWDTYNFIETDNASTLYSRQYNELPSVPANVLCQVSFNGGTNYNPTVDSSVLTIPVPQQGTSFIIKLTNASASRLSIGSWTVIY